MSNHTSPASDFMNGSQANIRDMMQRGWELTFEPTNVASVLLISVVVGAVVMLWRFPSGLDWRWLIKHSIKTAIAIGAVSSWLFVSGVIYDNTYHLANRIAVGVFDDNGPLQGATTPVAVVDLVAVKITEDLLVLFAPSMLISTYGASAVFGFILALLLIAFLTVTVVLMYVSNYALAFTVIMLPVMIVFWLIPFTSNFLVNTVRQCINFALMQYLIMLVLVLASGDVITLSDHTAPSTFEGFLKVMIPYIIHLLSLCGLVLTVVTISTAIAGGLGMGTDPVSTGTVRRLSSNRPFSWFLGR